MWEPSLASNGATILRERVEWMERNSDEFARLAHAMGERQQMAMRYVTSVGEPLDAEQELRDTLARRRAIDIKRGLTHAGPHRDDIDVLVGEHDLRVFGSGGQHRTAAVALKLLEAATLKQHAQTDPLLLLDDPFAELDSRRSGRILDLLHATITGQTVLAVPRASDIPPDMTRLQRWRVSAGTIEARAA